MNAPAKFAVNAMNGLPGNMWKLLNPSVNNMSSTEHDQKLRYSCLGSPIMNTYTMFEGNVMSGLLGNVLELLYQSEVRKQQELSGVLSKVDAT